MAGFLDAMLSFPTVLFTVPLGVMVVYWILVIVGALGIPTLELDADAGFEALEGSLEGVADGALEGAAEGAMEAGADGAADGLVEASAGHGVLTSILHALQLGTVPVTVSLSLLFFFGWSASLLGHLFLGPVLGDWSASVVGGLVVLPLALVGGFLLTAASVRPLSPLFVVHRAPSKRHLAGRICEVTTGKVTRTFGQAELADGGAGLILRVVCDKEDALKRGDLAVIVSFDEGQDAYEIEPVDWLAPGERIGRYRAADIIQQLKSKGKL